LFPENLWTQDMILKVSARHMHSLWLAIHDWADSSHSLFIIERFF